MKQKATVPESTASPRLDAIYEALTFAYGKREEAHTDRDGVTDPGVPLSGGSFEPEAAASSTPAKFHNVIIAEGSVDGVAKFLEELRQVFPDLSEETPGEAARHRGWLQRETGGFQKPLLGQTTVSCAFQTTLPRSATDLLDSMAVIQKFKRTAISLGLTLGHIALNTERSPIATALAYCSDSNTGVVGTFFNSRREYFQVMQHLLYGDDFVRLRTDIATGAMGPLPYIHECQWDEAFSPMRISFRTEDPFRGDLGLGFEAGETGERAKIVRDGLLPPEGQSVNIQLRWGDAYLVIERAWECGVEPFFDNEAQLMVSGYGLFNAGVIDDRVCVQVETHQAPGRNCSHNVSAAMVDGEIPEEQARKCFMILYSNLLAVYAAHSGPTTEQRAIACDHLEGAYKWLVENSPLPSITPGSSAVN